ncbi:GTPase obg [Thermodesulfobium narugense DSM 14796]|uniref:GTPase Obg n=1 Tax=Thermodesulfobium narugense DSM 14796 TaxID=747365 RepID=M1E859_9BACT|nr:GTPase ObgE [Thermodesulfobium narugense]AEE14978.1 GTPase obg [Thermodesulfobium narugense DSM 14796]
MSLRSYIFPDTARVKFVGGHGGRGCVSFRKEKYVPKGGPDGGDGGRGANIYLVASREVSDLSFFKSNQEFRGKNGEPGSSKKMHGKDAQDLYINVPIGTLVRDLDTNEIICDLDYNGKVFLVAKGGKGGLGNSNFATPTNRVPHYAQDGEPGEEKNVLLELKIIADASLIGFPNAGKSSLLNALTNAKAIVGEYSFTTIKPVLGVLSNDEKSIVLADIPGIIEGASKGKGLGNIFLRHIERSNFLIFVLDASLDPIKYYNIIIKELEQYNKNLLQKKRIILLNKRDLIDKNTENKLLIYFKGLNEQVYSISTFDKTSIEALKNIILESVSESKILV